MGKYAVFGGTNGVGKEFVKLALESGHTVKVLARSPQKLEDIQQKLDSSKKGETERAYGTLEIIHGDVFDMESVKKTLEDQDAIVISLGTRPFQSNSDPKVCSKGTFNIIQAVKERNETLKSSGKENLFLKRVVCVSSFAVGDSWDDSGWFAKSLFWLFLGRVLADKEIQEKYLKESDLDWTIFRPGGLTDGPLTGKVRVGEHISVAGTRVNRSDVAQVVLKELQDNQWLKKTPTVSS